LWALAIKNFYAFPAWGKIEWKGEERPMIKPALPQAPPFSTGKTREWGY